MRNSHRVLHGLSLVLLITALFFTSMPAHAVEATLEDETVLCEGYPIPNQSSGVSEAEESTFLPLIPHESRGLLSYINVYVSSPCDQYWRSEFSSNWMYMANYAVEVGDNFLANKFNIDYYSVAQNYWTNSVSDSYDQYYSAKNNVGKTNGADLMIAFSAKDTQFGGLGASDGYCLAWYFDYAGIDYTCNTVTHESGHMYGVHVDGGCSAPRLMSGTPNTICSDCYRTWNANKYKW